VRDTRGERVTASASGAVNGRGCGGLAVSAVRCGQSRPCCRATDWSGGFLRAGGGPVEQARLAAGHAGGAGRPDRRLDPLRAVAAVQAGEDRAPGRVPAVGQRRSRHLAARRSPRRCRPSTRLPSARGGGSSPRRTGAGPPAAARWPGRTGEGRGRAGSRRRGRPPPAYRVTPARVRGFRGAAGPPDQLPRLCLSPTAGPIRSCTSAAAYACRGRVCGRGCHVPGRLTAGRCRR
jgi:hypothetical protein